RREGRSQGGSGSHSRGGARRDSAGRGTRERATAQPGRGSRRRGRVEDPPTRSRSEGPRRIAGVDSHATLTNAMAEPTTVARPYAQAAFELAREQNALPVWSEMLRFATTIVADERVTAALENPRLSTGDK